MSFRESAAATRQEGDSTWAGRLFSHLRQLPLGLAWVLAVGMVAAVLAWLAGFAPWSPLKWINAFTGYIYLPAYFCLAVALVTRRKVLAAWFGVICVWHLAVVLPTILPVREARARGEVTWQVDTGKRVLLRVFYANVGKTNDRIEDLFDELRASDADLLVLTEFTDDWHDKFNESELPADYPHHVHLFDYSPAATGVYSRSPLLEDERVYQEKRVVVHTTVDLGRAKLELYALHAPRPVRSPLHQYEEFWGIVEQQLAQEEGARLVIGDFNATPYSLIYRRLTRDGGLLDCQELCGRGYVTTWPNGTRLLPPIRIDHALVSPDVACLQISTGVGVGSDHKPLSLTLAIPVSNAE